jgi:hypothetical protein
MVKRANQQAPKPVAQRIREDPDAWQKELDWWSDLSINTDLLLTSLDGVLAERRVYERGVRARDDSLTALEIREARKALRRAQLLIELFKTARTDEEGLFFGDLGDQVVTAVQKYIAIRRPALPANRPIDPWVKKRVLVWVRLLRARRQSWRRTQRAIYTLLKLAGHDDVVTSEMIRHIFRAELKRNPAFGPTKPDPRDRPWFTSPVRK